jgi:hypothetical protein
MTNVISVSCRTQGPLTTTEYAALHELLRVCDHIKREPGIFPEVLSMVARMESIVYRDLARGVR